MLLMQLLLSTILISSSEMANDNIIKNSENYLKEDTARLLDDTERQNDIWYDTLVNGNICNFNDTPKWDDFVYDSNGSIELIVGINSRLNSYSKLEEVVNENGGSIINDVLMDGVMEAIVVDLPFASMASFVKEIRDFELSKYVEPNLKVQAQFIPNDPYWGLQWGPQKIEANWAWNTTIGDSSVLVAVVDTGVDYYHPDLAANYVALGYDWVNNDADPMDDNGHGTHCAGIIAAGLSNSIGIAGLAQIKIMAEKALDMSGSGSMEWVVNAIIHATDQGANIISMSWGASFHSKLLYEAIRYAYDAGVLLVAAAGNDATDHKVYPAAYDEVIAVAATDYDDGQAQFSNFGNWIELAAPGVNVYSTVLDNGYANKSGTSMAAPHVVGVAALVWSSFPYMSRDQLRFYLRYTADDLGSLGFDESYGYGRINAKKAVEQTLPEHDLLIMSWNRPSYVEPNSTAIINCTILNFGTHNESDVTVQLLINNTQVSNTTINELSTGASATISCYWSPTREGKYNLTIQVLAAPNETNMENNVAWEYTFVGVPTKVVVVRSAGTFLNQVTYTWETLNSRWYDYGDIIVSIDYTTLDKENITYENIKATNADILIISCAYSPESGWEFSNSEIDAITKYTYEGHGLIATAGTFYFPVSNNNKLTRIFGIDEATEWNATFTSELNVLEPEHQLFRRIPNPYIMSTWAKSTAVPFSGKWDEDILVGGEYVALGSSRESAIVTYRGLVYISPWIEISAGQDDMQLFYNAITWSHYERPDHDLIVPLDTPLFLKFGDSMLLNATVSNIGLQNETNIKLSLLIDSNTVANVTIPELLSSSSYTLNYSWHPAEKRVYNITVSAHAIAGESNPLNNLVTRLVSVADPVIWPIEGQWANYTLFNVDGSELQEVGQMKLTYDHYISPYQINVTYWYKSSRGSISKSWLVVNALNKLVEKGTWAGWWYPAWIESNITLGSKVRLLDRTATVIGSRTIEVYGRPIDCWELLLRRYNTNYTLYYDKPSGLLIEYYLVTSSFQEKLMLTSTNILIGTLIRPKPGNYANYKVTHFSNDAMTAIGTMNFTYIAYVDSRRFRIRIEYALYNIEGKPVENFTEYIIVNIQTRLVESGLESWNNTNYGYWIETFIKLGSPVNLWNQTGTVIGFSNYTLDNRLFNTLLIYSANETRICFYHYDQVTGLLLKSTTNSLSLPSENVTFTLLQTNIDVSPPFITITYPQHGAVLPYTTVDLLWDGWDLETGMAYYLVYVDADLLVNLTHPSTHMMYIITDLNEGKHVIQVEAYDLEGNVNSDRVDIIIDVTEPTASIIAPSNGSYLEGDFIAINVTGDDVTSFDKMELYINDFLAVTFFSGGVHSYAWKTETYNGRYTIILIVYDKAHHQTESSITVTVDNTLPLAEIMLPMNGSYIRNNVNITFNFDDDNFENATLLLDGKILTQTTEAYSYMWNTTQVADGEHSITLRVYDKAGNKKESIVTIFTDNTEPMVKIMSPQNGTIISRSCEFTFIAFDANLRNASLVIGDVTIDVLGKTALTLNVSDLQDGAYTAKLIARDNAGNQVDDLITILVDNTCPNVSIISPLEGTKVAGATIINFTVEDAHMSATLLFIDNMMINLTGDTVYEWNSSRIGDGSHEIRIVAIDQAGNIGDAYVTVSTINVQKAVEANRMRGMILGILIGATTVIVGIMIYYTFRRKNDL